MQDENPDEGEERNKSLSDQDITEGLDRNNNLLPVDISEYVQKVRDELKQYKEQKEYYEKRRKKEIVLELVGLLEKHKYPKNWLRTIIAQELGDYISTNYIEKILAEQYPNEKKKKVEEESTHQLAEIPQNDDKISIEISTTGESIIDNDNHFGNSDPHDKKDMIQGCTPGEPSEGFTTDLERQVEEGTKEIIRTLQKRIKDLETRCYQLDRAVQEGSR